MLFSLLPLPRKDAFLSGKMEDKDGNVILQTMGSTTVGSASRWKGERILVMKNWKRKVVWVPVLLGIMTMLLSVTVWASGFESPIEGETYYLSESIPIKYVTGYASSNRQTYCEIMVFDSDEKVALNETFSYDNLGDTIETTFTPFSTGAYRIKASLYYFITNTDYLSGQSYSYRVDEVIREVNILVSDKKPISQNVTFKVENGSWNSGKKADITVTLTGHEGDALKLTSDQIPPVGDKPDTNYKKGGWDTTPSTSTVITKDITYTYKYTKAVAVKKTTWIDAKNKSYKVKKKTKAYSVTLKSGKTPVKGVKVKLKVKGKTYVAVTNKKGKAEFKIKNLKKKGKYTATVTFAGNKSYKKAVKKVRITVKK